MWEKTGVKRGYGAVLLGFLMALESCGSKMVYESAHNLPASLWHKDSVLIFEPLISDTSEVLNIGLTLDHNNHFPYSNLWLFIRVKGPDGMQQVDTMEYFLAGPDGEWMGKGSDSRRRLYWLYKAGVKMRYPGVYSFEIHQGMRDESLRGVEKLELWIEEADDGKK